MRTKRPATSELGRLLNLTDTEWTIHEMERRVERLMNARLHLSLWTVLGLIAGTLLGRPIPRKIPL